MKTWYREQLRPRILVAARERRIRLAHAATFDRVMRELLAEPARERH